METKPAEWRTPARLAPAPAEDVRTALRHPVFEARTFPENGEVDEAVREQCPNCAAERWEDGDYCHQCGQEFLGGRLTLWRFWHEFAERYLKLESGLWLTFREMCTDPGGVARRYIEGQRRRYTNPLGYFLLTATVLVIALTLVEPIYKERMVEQTRQMNAQLYGPEAPERTEEAFTHIFPEADDPMRAYVDFYVGFQKQMNTYLSLVLCVVFALLLRFVFPGPAQGGHTLAEMLVFSTFIVAHGILLSLPVLYGLVLANFAQSMIAMFLGVVVYIALAAWGARAFFSPTAASSVLGGTAMLFAYLVFFVVTVTVAVTVMMWDLLVQLAQVLLERAL